MQILVLIISSNTLPIYKYNKEIWRLYMNNFPNIDSYFIEYNSELELESDILEKDTLYFKGIESFENIIHKTLKSIDFFINQITKKYDFIIRSNLSTVCDFHMLQKYLLELPIKNNIYAGHFGPYYNLETYYFWFNFVGGTGIIMSRDICEMLLESSNRILAENFKNMDDIDIGFVMYHNNIPLIGIPHLCIDSLDNLNNSVSIICERKFIFYRVKNHGNRENETECMRKILSYFNFK